MSACSAAPVRGAVVLFAAGLLVVAGCNKPVGTVSGKVTYQGKALKGGGVTFVSTDGGRSFAGIIGPDGSYKVTEIVGGTYKVTVDNNSLKGQERTGPATAAPPPLVPAGAKGGPPPGANLPAGYVASDPNAMKANAAGKNYVALPPKYLSADTTDITYEFKGDDTFNVELK